SFTSGTHPLSFLTVGSAAMANESNLEGSSDARSTSKGKGTPRKRLCLIPGATLGAGRGMVKPSRLRSAVSTFRLYAMGSTTLLGATSHTKPVIAQGFV